MNSLVLNIKKVLPRKINYLLVSVIVLVALSLVFLFYPFYEGAKPINDREEDEDNDDEADDEEDEADDEEEDENPTTWRDAAQNFRKSLYCYFFDPHDSTCKHDLDNIETAAELYVDAVQLDTLQSDVHNRLYK